MHRASCLTLLPTAGTMRAESVPGMARRVRKLRRMTLLLAVVAAVLVVASGVALARDFVGTDRGERIVGTDSADTIDGNGGDDTIIGKGGPDRIRGGNGSDEQYGGPGNDGIDADGGVRGLVNCGTG